MFTYSQLLVDVWGIVVSAVKGTKTPRIPHIATLLLLANPFPNNNPLHPPLPAPSPFPIQDKYENQKEKFMLEARKLISLLPVSLLCV